mmetsp:Transcript_1576/g.2816  ORF Transcript_1576/g.2816 Transcript_1576/m.2816 type:complete len:273 (+) Transcript_1576:2824-3642(+)
MRVNTLMLQRRPPALAVGLEPSVTPTRTDATTVLQEPGAQVATQAALTARLELSAKLRVPQAVVTVPAVTRRRADKTVARPVPQVNTQNQQQVARFATLGSTPPQTVVKLVSSARQEITRIPELQSAPLVWLAHSARVREPLPAVTALRDHILLSAPLSALRALRVRRVNQIILPALLALQDTAVRPSPAPPLASLVKLESSRREILPTVRAALRGNTTMALTLEVRRSALTVMPAHTLEAVPRVAVTATQVPTPQLAPPPVRIVFRGRTAT